MCHLRECNWQGMKSKHPHKDINTSLFVFLILIISIPFLADATHLWVAKMVWAHEFLVRNFTKTVFRIVFAISNLCIPKTNLPDTIKKAVSGLVSAQWKTSTPRVSSFHLVLLLLLLLLLLSPWLYTVADVMTLRNYVLFVLIKTSIH